MAKAVRRRFGLVQDIDRQVGARIRQRRISLGLTQKRMAALIGITYQQANKYETGLSHSSAGRLYQVAEALGVDVGHFFEAPGEAPAELSVQQRMMIELARNFLAISTPRLREAVAAIARFMAADYARDGGGE